MVEDDHDIRFALRAALEFEGYTVHVATNGKEALAILPNIQPLNLILLDQNMPIMSGAEFLVEKNKSAALAEIPVVILSAVSNLPVPHGVKEFLRKPVELDLLLDTVQRYCSA